MGSTSVDFSLDKSESDIGIHKIAKEDSKVKIYSIDVNNLAYAKPNFINLQEYLCTEINFTFLPTRKYWDDSYKFEIINYNDKKAILIVYGINSNGKYVIPVKDNGAILGPIGDCGGLASEYAHLLVGDIYRTHYFPKDIYIKYQKPAK